jgi:hypothetical protein
MTVAVVMGVAMAAVARGVGGSVCGGDGNGVVGGEAGGSSFGG